MSRGAGERGKGQERKRRSTDETGRAFGGHTPQLILELRQMGLRAGGLPLRCCPEGEAQPELRDCEQKEKAAVELGEREERPQLCTPVILPDLKLGALQHSP